MANPVCGVNAILKKVDDIKKIIRKYTIIADGVTSWPAVQGLNATISVSLAPYFSQITSTDAFKTLYNSVTKIFDYVGTGLEQAQRGIDAINSAQAQINEVINDFGDVVGNLSGILQDIQDLTSFDIQILELDLARLGFNPGEIITRIKDGEPLNVVLGDAAKSLSESSRSLLEKISNPLTISFDDTCAKIPNVAIIEVNGVKTKVFISNPPASNSPAPISTPAERPVIVTEAPADTTGAASNQPAVESNNYKLLESFKDSKYNWQYLATGKFGEEANDITKYFKDVSPVLSKKLNMLPGDIELYIKLNLDVIGAVLIKPLIEKYPGITINSGWRSKLYVDKKQNSSEERVVSQHAYGCAFDFQIPEKYVNSYWKTNDTPIDFLKRTMATTKIGNESSRVGHYKIVREMPQRADKSYDQRIQKSVFHIQAVYVPFVTNTYNGPNFNVITIPKLY